MLALWGFFWEGTDWSGIAPPAPAPTPQESRGGGHKKENDRLGVDYWDARERYLRRFAEPLIKEVAPVENTNSPEPEEVDKLADTAPGRVDYDNSALLLYQQAMAAALQAAYAAQNAQHLQDAVQRANALSLDIARIKQQHYNRAIAVLLLNAF